VVKVSGLVSVTTLEQAERFGAYVGEAVSEHRRRAIPVSTLLTPGGL
jgi:hypothetical protein